MSSVTRTALYVGLMTIAARGAAAQPQDLRWTPWIGCWQTVEGGETPASDDLLCVRPAPGGVEMIEVVDGQSRSTRTLIADGQPRDATIGDCTAWSSLEFALDGHRLFTRGERACEMGPLGSSTGVIAMVAPREWIDVQASEANGRVLSWVRRFRPARVGLVEAAGLSHLVASSAVSRAAARVAAAAPDVDDIIEASRTVQAEAVRAWVAELDDPFDLDSRSLLRLADAGVPSSVIDVMIAVSYPDRFALQRDGDIDEIGYRTPQHGIGYSRRTFVVGRTGWYRDPFYYSPFGYRYGYGYSRPYRYWYGRPYGYYDQPGFLIVVPREDPERGARVVRGRGYTRGSGGTDRSAAPASSPTRRGGQPSASSPRSPSGSGSAVPSSGSGRSSTGRTARPREN